MIEETHTRRPEDRREPSAFSALERSTLPLQPGLVASPTRSGFAVPVVIFVITVISVLVTGAFYSARQETRIGVADENSTLAFYMAERSTNDLLAGWDPSQFGALALWGSTQVSDTSDLGVVDISVTRGGDRLYYLDATSRITARGSRVEPSYRIGTIARLQTAELEPRAALTTRNNLSIKGNATLDGRDTSPSAWGSLCAGTVPRDKPGLVIDDTAGFGTSGQGAIDGVPPMVEDPSLDQSDFSQFGDFDWDDLVSLANKTLSGGNFNTTGPVLDASGNCNRTHNLNWGDPRVPGAPCFNYFPVIHINGDARMQSGGVGQGILLVEGNLDLRGGFEFYGLVLVKGNFETQGSGNRLIGSVMAANADLQSQALVGGSEVQFSSCVVDRTLQNISGLSRARRIDRGWVDVSAMLY